MKQQQVLLALLLLALTCMSAVAGGMNTTEPFMEHDGCPDGMVMNEETGECMPSEDFMEKKEKEEKEVVEVPVKGEGFQSQVNPMGQNVNSVNAEGFQSQVNPMGQNVNAVNAEGFQSQVNPMGQNVNGLEGFSGGMYAGF